MVRRKKRVLWVEDSARFELPNVLGPIYASHEYDLTLAENATKASSYLRRSEFDAIIMDVRLPPGNHAYWREIYQNAGSDRTNAKLGLALLGWLLKGEGSEGPPLRATPPKRPTWSVRPAQIAVFSVESRQEIDWWLGPLGVTTVIPKGAGQPNTVLLDIAAQLVAARE